MKKLLEMLVFVAVLFALNGAETIIPMDKLKNHNSVSEQIGDVLRVRIPTQPNKWWGTVGQYIKGVKGEYVQVNVIAMENAASTISLVNASTNGGTIGQLLTGENTFILPEHATNKSFYLSIVQVGNKNEKIGPWVDYKNIITTDKPKNAPIVELITGDSVKVGSSLKISLNPSISIADKPEVKFFVVPKMVPYQFNNDESVVLEAKDDGTYFAEIKVDENAFSFSSLVDKAKFIVATTKIGDSICYYTLPFSFDIETKKKIDYTLINSATPKIYAARKLYLEQTKGINLAKGKTLKFVPTPDYNLTVDEKDVTDLTDGKITNRTDDKVWFDRNAVGWYSRGNKAFIALDLGKVEPVKDVIIRLLGGTTGNFKFPEELKLYVSKNGKEYHLASSMKKLVEGERAQCDWDRYYYLEEKTHWAQAYMHPFPLKANADARYIILEITGAADAIFSDELVCLKSEVKTENFNEAYSVKGIEIPMEGLIVRPRVQKLVIINGIAAPQNFTITDLRDIKDRKAGQVVLELPQGVDIIGKTGDKLPSGATKYIIDMPFSAYYKSIITPTIYLTATGEIKGDAIIYAKDNNQEYFKTTLPVKIINPPTIKPFEKLHISLSWMNEKDTREWPDFYNNWRKLGFNVVSTFPRYWTNKTAVKNGKEFVKKAHDKNFPVIMNDSPFHEMMRGKKAGDEIYCQIAGENHTMLCPSYRGESYDKEMERVKNCVINGTPKYVFYDIECWHNAIKSAPKCSRCKAEMEKFNLSLEEFLFSKGKENMLNLKKAVESGAKEANIAMPILGSYHRQPSNRKYAIEQWVDIYPSSIDMSQPSLYVAGRAKDVHDAIRRDYNLLNNKNIIPWLTTGTYGEFDSYKIEPMILETFMNGANGITYFKFSDFDSPLDFYYHLKALAAIRPYENLIVNGKVTDVKASNEKLTYSMLVDGDELLLLVGNYVGAEVKTTVSLPFAPEEILDVIDNEKVNGNKEFTFDVPKDTIRLFYIKKKKTLWLF